MNWTQVYTFIRSLMALDPDGQGLDPTEGPLAHRNLLSVLLAGGGMHALPDGLKDLCKGPLCHVLVSDGYDSLIALRPETVACLGEIELRASQEEADRKQKACEVLWKEEDRLLSMLDGYHAAAAGPADIAPGLLRLLEAAGKGGRVRVATDDVNEVYAVYGA